MTRIMAIVSQKGGVGKTALTLNLGYELAVLGQRVLLVDFDPQADLTSCAGLEDDDERATIYDAMLDPDETALCIVPIRDGLGILPADWDLSGAELEFSRDQSQRNTRLKTVMSYVANDHDYVIIDCPPSLGFFTANALIAANQILVPLQCEHLALKALGNLFEIVQRSRQQNADLKIAGIIATFYDRRNSLSKEVTDAAREELGKWLLKTMIPRNVAVAHASGRGLPVGKFAPNSASAVAYRELAKEINNA